MSTHALRAAGVSVWVALATLPGTVAAQSICSAPHSSPTLAGARGSATLEPGTGWAQLAAYRHVTGQSFGPRGESRPFFSDGRATTHSVFLTAAAGLTSGIELWAQLPVHSLRFEDQAGRRERTGLGDARLALRLDPGALGAGSLPLAVRAGIKLPGSSFPVDATILPLTEGQRDWELSVETWRTSSGGALSVAGWVGYRWREEKVKAARKPGDERFLHLEVGGLLGTWRWGISAELLDGLPPLAQGIELPSARRRLFQLQPGFGRQLGVGRLDVGAQLPVSGRNLPGGASVNLAYLVPWGTP